MCTNGCTTDFLSWLRDSGWSITALMFWILWNWLTNQMVREICTQAFPLKGKKHFLIVGGQSLHNAVYIVNIARAHLERR